MSQLSLLEQHYKTWKKKQVRLNTYLMDLEANIQNLENRVSKLEAEMQELITKLNKLNSVDNIEELWIKIRDFAMENRTSQLLNPSKIYRFQIIEINRDYIRIDKLTGKKLTKQMFISVIIMLQKKSNWVRIGSSVTNTKPDTVEGYIKKNFYKGNMNGNMTAPWISAILVRANVGVIFNNKAVGQALSYSGNKLTT